VLLALCAAALVCVARGQTSAILDQALNHKETAVASIKARLESGAVALADGSLDAATCGGGAASSCTAALGTPFCDINFGNTAGCSCRGRAIDTSKSVIKTSAKLDVSATALKRTACLAAHLQPNLTAMYSTMIETGDTKWLYFGSKDGVIVNYPGFVWGDQTAPDGCDEYYDSRLRPWQMTAATGPKNIVLILDVSGSMSVANRLGLMKAAAVKVIDSATHSDYIGIVTFNNAGATYQGLTTMAKALPAFRTRLKSYIGGLSSGGGTNFEAGFAAAFALIDSSRAKKYAASCHTTYMFLTDGIATNPKDMIRARQATDAGKDEHYFTVAFGTGTDYDMLRGMSCDIGAVFTPVPDGDEAALQRAMISYYKFYALQKTLSKVEGFTWTEPYTSVPDIWGPLTSVSAPVYDKTREPWHMMGVASADATVCNLELKAPETPAPATLTTVTGCTCKSGAWTYKGVSYSGCSDVDWPVPWCATGPGCGVCDSTITSTGCWDDCQATGQAAALESELLRRATSWCESSDLPACAVEALRRTADPTHAAACTVCSAADIEKYQWAIDGPDANTSAAATSAAAGFTLSSTSGGLAGTLFDSNTATCSCSTDMSPSCSCTAPPPLSPFPPPSPPAPPKEEGAKEELPIGIIVGAIAGVMLIAVVWGVYLRCVGRGASKPPMWGGAG